MPNTKPDDEDWKKALELIKHENELVNHRISSTLTFQGLLYAGLGLSSIKIFDLYAEKEYYPFIILSCAVFIISIVGLSSSTIITTGIRAAMRQVNASSLWLVTVKQNRCDNFKKIYPCPPITGNPSKYSFIFHLIGRDTPYYDYYGTCELKPHCKKNICKDYVNSINDIGSLSLSTHMILDVVQATWAILIIFMLISIPPLYIPNINSKTPPFAFILFELNRISPLLSVLVTYKTHPTNSN